MFCEKCGSPARIADFVCSKCGSSFHETWFKRSAFCFGGFGTRYHVYDYSGMNALIVQLKPLKKGCSYPLHINGLLFFTENNWLYVTYGEKIFRLKIDNNDMMRYHPVIAPPTIFLIPINISSPIKHVNVVTLADQVERGDMDPPKIETLPDSVISNEMCPPAVFFDPQNPFHTYKIAFWNRADLMVLRSGSQNIQRIYQAVGLSNAPANMICFDDYGDIWFASPGTNSIIRIKDSEGYQAGEFPCRGTPSAPICVNNEIYYYLSAHNQDNRAMTFLVKHPGIQITSFPFSQNAIQPQHLSNQGADHPGFLASEKISGLHLPDQYKNIMRDSLHPVWLDVNGVNCFAIIT